jgi:antirestriction protein ArdC
MNTEKQDIYSTITNQIIEAIEQGIGKEKISLPWHRIDNENPIPKNVATRQYYRGINTLILWCIAEKQKYTSGIWMKRAYGGKSRRLW